MPRADTLRDHIYDDKDNDNEINLTPMLDVVFIMLIFFIVTASFIKETGIDVDQPEADTAQTTDDANILISITDTNDIWIDGRLIDPRAIRPNIERLHAENP
ncbi:MAG: ExbD/TolR family protein, partial [Woeseia sp.]